MAERNSAETKTAQNFFTLCQTNLFYFYFKKLNKVKND